MDNFSFEGMLPTRTVRSGTMAIHARTAKEKPDLPLIAA